MVGKKLTQKDVREWCSAHRCEESSCEYLRGYCHIAEFVCDECNNCMDGRCKGCPTYK